MPFCHPYRIFLYTSGTISCIGDPSQSSLYLWLSDYRVLFINLKKRLVLSVGVPLLSMEPNVKDPPLVICDLVNPVSWYLDASKSYAINKILQFYICFLCFWIANRGSTKYTKIGRWSGTCEGQIYQVYSTPCVHCHWHFIMLQVIWTAVQASLSEYLIFKKCYAWWCGWYVDFSTRNMELIVSFYNAIFRYSILMAGLAER